MYDTKSPRKGRRLYFVAAMSISGEAEISCFIPGSVWLFCPTSKDGHKGDYGKLNILGGSETICCLTYMRLHLSYWTMQVFMRINQLILRI